MIQVITPDPGIPCRPGWCLQYVREAFGLPARYPTATAAWEASTSQHRDRDFPAGVWVPVWYGVAGVPEGHVVLLGPDGSVYSTTHPTRLTPTYHPNLGDLENTYARAGLPLTFRGWTEDVAGFPVVTAGTITPQGTITTTEEEGDDMFTEQDRAVINANRIEAEAGRKEATNAKLSAQEAARIATDARNEATNAKLAARAGVDAMAKLAVAGGAAPADVDAILDALADRLKA